MAKMSTIKRESSRLSSSKNSTVGSEKPHGRPSLISRAYNTVSYRGDRASGNRLGKVATNTSEATLGEGAGTKDLKSFNGVFPIPEPECKPGSPPKLNEEQEKKYKEILEYFQRVEDLPVSLQADNTKREAVSEWEKLRMLSRESMLRYLRATRWDVTAAKKRLTDTIAWRREFGVDKLDPDEMAKEAKSGKETVLGYDNMSRPLHYMHPHRNDTKESPRQMQFAVWILERCIDLMPPGTEQLALLINFDHKSRNPTSIANAKLMLYILQNHYVERLGIALCINVPWVFKMFWNAIQPFIDPVTKSKCKFDEAIKTEVPVSQLSSEFGGELDAKYNHDKYWPDLVKLSDERRKEMIRRFKEDCNSEIGASEWVIRGGDDDTSPFNKSKKVAALSEMTTTSKSSDMGPSSDPQGGEKAREAAIAASDKRRAEGTTPMYEEPMTPLERYQTPSDTLNKNPLDRQFSTTSSEGQTSSPAATGAGAAAAAPALETTAEKPEEEAKADSKQQSRPSSGHNGWHHFEEEMSKGFKDFNHKIQGAFSASHSRRSSRERELSADGKTKKKRESSKLRDMAIEDDRKENVENGQGAEQGIVSKIPSAQEAAAVAGAAGVTGAAGAVGGHSTGQIAEEDVKAATVSSTAADADEKKKEDGGSNTIHVLYFAAAKEAAGTGRQKVELPVSPSPFPLSELGTYLSKAISDAGKGDAKAFESVLQRSRWSVNEDMIEEEEISKLTLKGGEDVAIIPPVSGG